MECGERRPLNNFPYNKDSKEYKDYFINPILKGFATKPAFSTVCQSCVRNHERQAEIQYELRVKNDPAMVEMLRLMTGK